MLKTLSISLALLSGIAACSDGGHDVETSSGPVDEAPPWSYEGETGPPHWSSIDDDYAACADSDEQSPVDLPGSMAESDVPDLVTHYGESGVAIVNTGETIRYDYDAGSELQLGTKRYPLLQFHFHAHAEHAIDGRFAPLELHLVHQTAAGETAVLGVLFELGEENRTLADAAWDELPGRTAETFESDERRYDISELLPGGPSYRYQGSLTTPPCTDGVQWTVFAAHATLSQAQLDRFTDLFSHNYRPLQPLAARSVAFGD